MVPALPRERLAEHPAHLLKDEGQGAARVTRIDLPDGPVVLKEWAPTRSRTLRWWASLLMRREIRHYRLLDGTLGIPRFRGAYGEDAFLIDYVEAVPLKRGLPPELLEAALDGLEHALAAIHARRFAHLDLHQKLNALVDRDGHVWLIDLGQGLDCSRGLLRRMLFPLLAAIDRRAVEKFRARWAPHTLDDEQRERLVKRHGRRGGRRWKNLRRRVRSLLSGDP